jgi:hypothetical protein
MVLPICKILPNTTTEAPEVQNRAKALLEKALPIVVLPVQDLAAIIMEAQEHPAVQPVVEAVPAVEVLISIKNRPQVKDLLPIGILPHTETITTAIPSN